MRMGKSRRKCFLGMSNSQELIKFVHTVDQNLRASIGIMQGYFFYNRELIKTLTGVQILQYAI